MPAGSNLCRLESLSGLNPFPDNPGGCQETGLYRSRTGWSQATGLLVSGRWKVGTFLDRQDRVRCQQVER